MRQPGFTLLGLTLVRGLAFSLAAFVVVEATMLPARQRRDVVRRASTYGAVPAVVGAEMMLTGKWRGKGVFNMEQFDPDPFMATIGPRGLPWTVTTLNAPMD